MTTGFPTSTWRGIEAQDPPWAIDDWPELHAMAETMLAARQRRFPAWIREGRISEGDAKTELTTFAAMAAHWRWVCTGEGEPAHLATLHARQSVIDASLDTIVEIAREQRGFSAELALQAQHVIALRWHAEINRELDLIRLTRLTREIRKRAAPAADPRSAV